MSSKQDSIAEQSTTDLTRVMEGGIYIKGIYERSFRASAVAFEILPALIQVFGVEAHGTPEASQILLQLKPGTVSGFYQFNDPAVIHLGYQPPYQEGHYETTSGAFILNIDPEAKKVSGHLLFQCMRGDIEKEVDVTFDIQNL